MTIKVGFDARYIRTDHHDGISRFSSRVGSELHRLVSSRNDIEVTFLINTQDQARLLPPGASVELISSPTSSREPWVSRSVNALGFDVVFSPMQTMGSRGRKYRLILTVHDLIYYRHPMPPRQFNLFLRLGWRLYHTSWWPQRWLLNGADAIVAVSHTTANLISQHKLTKRPVYVVPNAADPVLVTANQSQRSKSLVYMGSFMPYKNVETLIQAVRELPDYTLHLLSRIDPRDKGRLESMSEGASVVFHEGVSDAEYVDLLQSAQALVTASLDEGFGIPVIEAMSVGTPVVCSDITIFREIGGDAAIFVPAQDSKAFAQEIRSLEDPGEFLKRQKLGIERATHYSWEKSARELLDVLVQVSTEGTG